MFLLVSSTQTRGWKEGRHAEGGEHRSMLRSHLTQTYDQENQLAIVKRAPVPFGKICMEPESDEVSRVDSSDMGL
jgi:hypothetical protein